VPPTTQDHPPPTRDVPVQQEEDIKAEVAALDAEDAEGAIKDATHGVVGERRP
jgi:hypothetical protein